MVHDGADVPQGQANLDAVQVRFDQQRLVSHAGLLLAATLADTDHRDHATIELAIRDLIDTHT